MPATATFTGWGIVAAGIDGSVPQLKRQSNCDARVPHPPLLHTASNIVHQCTQATMATPLLHTATKKATHPHTTHSHHHHHPSAPRSQPHLHIPLAEAQNHLGCAAHHQPKLRAAGPADTGCRHLPAHLPLLLDILWIAGLLLPLPLLLLLLVVVWPLSCLSLPGCRNCSSVPCLSLGQ